MFDPDRILHISSHPNLLTCMYFVNAKPSSERRIEASFIDVIIRDEILPLLYEEMWRLNQEMGNLIPLWEMCTRPRNGNLENGIVVFPAFCVH